MSAYDPSGRSPALRLQVSHVHLAVMQYNNGILVSDF
jgi:hypothetical protein